VHAVRYVVKQRQKKAHRGEQEVRGLQVDREASRSKQGVVDRQW
jgi:hypothetical protein